MISDTLHWGHQVPNHAQPTSLQLTPSQGAYGNRILIDTQIEDISWNGCGLVRQVVIDFTIISQVWPAAR